MPVTPFTTHAPGDTGTAAHINDIQDAVNDAEALLDTTAATVASLSTAVSTTLPAALTTHESDTTSVHGIADTSALATTAATTSAIATAVATHEADTTSVHGIANTAVLETTTGSAAKVAAHEADTTAVHGIADTSVLATATSVATAVANHEADTTSVHGIADTSALATTTAVATAVANHEADTTGVHGITDTSALATTSAVTSAVATHAAIAGSTGTLGHVMADGTTITASGGVLTAVGAAAVAADFQNSGTLMVLGQNAPAVILAVVPTARKAVGNDGQTELNTALATSGIHHVQVYGELIVDGPVLVTRMVKLSGATHGNATSGDEASTIKAHSTFSGGTYIIEVHNAADTAVIRDIQLENIRIDGAALAAGSAIDAVHWRVTHGRITNVRLDDLPRHGIVREGYGTNDAPDNRINFLTARGVKGYAVKSAGGSGDTYILQPLIHDGGQLAISSGTYDPSLGGGVDVGSTEQVMFGQFYANHGPAIRLASTRAQIIGTRIETNYHGIYVDGAEAPQIIDVKFMGNCRTGKIDDDPVTSGTVSAGTVTFTLPGTPKYVVGQTFELSGGSGGTGTWTGISLKATAIGANTVAARLTDGSAVAFTGTRTGGTLVTDGLVDGSGNDIYFNSSASTRAQINDCQFDSETPGGNNSAVNIFLGNAVATRIQIMNNTFDGLPATGAIRMGTNNTNCNIQGNTFSGGTIFSSFGSGTTGIVRNNVGYVTEAAGTYNATPGAVSTISIAHGLSSTAVLKDISVVPASVNARGLIAVNDMHVTYDATNIILNFESNLTAATAYSWYWSIAAAPC